MSCLNDAIVEYSLFTVIVYEALEEAYVSSPAKVAVTVALPGLPFNASVPLVVSKEEKMSSPDFEYVIVLPVNAVPSDERVAS